MEKRGNLGDKLLIARLICWGLTIFDLALGGLAVLAPRLLMRLLAPGEEPADVAPLRRAGTIWLFFVPVQAWAGVNTENPAALRAVSVLRLQEVPADPVWLATGSGFGWFGKFSLILAPTFNFAVGCFLAHVARLIDKEAGTVE